MADIGRVKLNVDDRGFAGPLLPDLAGPAMGGAAAGIPREFMQMLAEAHAMRQRQAAMQLRLMGEDIRNQRLSRDMARKVPGQSRNQQALEAAAVRQAAGQAKQATEGARQARIGTQAQLGRLGQAMSNPSPDTWGKLDRTAAYGTLSGLSGGAGLVGADPRDLLRQQPSGVGQAFDERQYARGMDASPYSFLRGNPGAPSGGRGRKPSGYRSGMPYEHGTLPTGPEEKLKEFEEKWPYKQRYVVDLPDFETTDSNLQELLFGSVERALRTVQPPHTPGEEIPTRYPKWAQGWGWRGYEHGSIPGTVPKTGNYKLHKNEIVVSAPQVAPGGELDSQLMNALIEDKMRKGITGKNPKGNGYADGTIRRERIMPYDPWAGIPPPPGGFTLPNRPETRLRLGAGRLSGFEDLPLGPELEPPGPGVRPEWSPDIEVERKIRGLLGPGEGGMTRTGPGIGPTGKAGGSSATSARVGRKLLGPGSSVDEIVEAVAKETGQAKGSLKGLPKGVLLGMAAGLGIYAAAKALGGSDDAAAPSAPAGPDFWSDPSAHSFGAMLRGVPGAAYGNIQENLGKLGEVWGGLTGAAPPPAQAQAAAAPLPAEEDLGSQSTSPSRGSLMGGGPADQGPAYTDDLEAALSRTRGGDLGTRENPLTLSGSSGLGPNSAGITAPPEGRGDEHIPEAERYFAPESAEWRRAESQRAMATANREKADRIRDYLLSEGEDMDSDTRKDLMHGADWLDKTAEMVETRHQERQEKREELWAKSQDAVVRADAEIQKAKAKGEEVRATIAQKSLDELEDSYQDLQKSYIDIKGEADDRGRERALRVMAQNRVAQAKLYGEDVSPEEAMLGIRLEMGEITPEEAQEELAALQGG